MPSLARRSKRLRGSPGRSHHGGLRLKKIGKCQFLIFLIAAHHRDLSERRARRYHHRWLVQWTRSDGVRMTGWREAGGQRAERSRLMRVGLN
jgi:hypothetical protein